MLMKKSTKCLFIVILNLSWSGKTSQQQGRYVHVTRPMSWSLAEQYCREHHTSLATFKDKDVYKEFKGPCRFNATCWIGLQRDINDPNVWKWFDGEVSSFTHWNTKQGQPDNLNGNENCVAMGVTKWFDLQCDHKKTFLCYDALILVKEKKTWEEALEHCRIHGTDPNSTITSFKKIFDLPHMHFGHDNLFAKEMILDAQTAEVWIGLRFLAGEWLWVNGMPLKENLPVCPAPGMYCGTISKNGDILPSRNCSERRNFFCSIWP